MSRHKLPVCLLFLLSLPLLAFAQQSLPSRVVNVALFKQGYGCIVREVTIPAGESEAVIADMPIPVHGTFWILTPAAITLSSAIAAEGERMQVVPAVTLSELLHANIGETVEVKTADGWLKGKLISMAENRTEKDSDAPAIPTNAQNSSPWYYRAPAPVTTSTPVVMAGNLLVLETPDGETALPVSAITQLRKPAGSGALKVQFTRTTDGATLHLHTRGPGGVVSIAYLTRGLTWAPSYRLDIAGATAHLQGKAVLINDAEDLVSQQLSCLAGFPNMKFSHVIDPLALKENVAQFLSSLQQPADDGSRGRNGAVMTQVMANSAYIPEGGSDTPQPELGSNEDVHQYRFKDVAIKQGERAYLPLLDQQVAFSDLYRWDVRDLRENTYRWYEPRADEQTPQAEDVWHAVRLKNAGKLPWTTAPVMVTSGDQFLGQDILYYTSAGSSTLVNITKAMEVKASFSENTLGHNETLEIGGHTYTVYKVAGKLQVNNFKGEKVNLVINKKLTGDLIESSIKPTTVKEEPRTEIANPHRTVTWEVEVPAGKSLEIDYKYKVYIW